MTINASCFITICTYIKQRALEARNERDATKDGTHDRDFQNGRLLGFNEVISIIQQQAEGLGLSLSELQLDDIEPDRDLV